MTIGIHSELAPLPRRPEQSVGLAITSVNLLSGDWPPHAAKPGEAKASIHLLPPIPSPFQRSDVLRLELTNTGDTAWPSAADGVPEAAATDIVISWRGAHRSVGEQRLPLAYTMQPGDQVREELPLVPPAAVERDGPWTVAIGPASRDGKSIPVEVPCVLHVVTDRGHETSTSKPEAPPPPRPGTSR